MRAHDDQVGALLLGDLDDERGRRTDLHDDVGVDPFDQRPAQPPAHVVGQPRELRIVGQRGSRLDGREPRHRQQDGIVGVKGDEAGVEPAGQDDGVFERVVRRF